MRGPESNYDPNDTKSYSRVAKGTLLMGDEPKVIHVGRIKQEAFDA